MNVLIAWRPSKWQEIIFSIRSIRKNYRDLDHIIVISEINPNIANTIHFYYPDMFFNSPLNYMEREKHINQKLYACATKLKLEKFIYQSDDQYWLKPLSDNFFYREQFYLDKFEIEPIKTKHHELLQKNKSPYWSWKLCLSDTLIKLQQQGKTHINYTTHIPSKITLKELETSMDFFGGWGFQLESGLYNVSPPIKSTPLSQKNIKKGFYSQESDFSDIEEFNFLSHDDIGLSTELKDFIISNFYK